MIPTNSPQTILKQVSSQTDFDGFPGANSFVAILQPDGASELIRYDAFVALLFKQLHDQKLDLLHGAVGISGEAGESAAAGCRKHSLLPAGPAAAAVADWRI